MPPPRPNAVPLLVRLRPNSAYLAFLALCIIVTVLGATFLPGVLGLLGAAGGALLLLMVGAPVLVSTVCRVPVIAVDDTGVRLPLAGVRLTWTEVAAVRQAADPTRVALLIFPVDPAAVTGQMRPWLRTEARTNLARYGTPLVVRPQSLDHTLNDIKAAIAQFQARPTSPRPPAGPST